ncbi:cation:proton antiporter [Sulfurovum mangrovi]|uniref:cation:proton antiporter n=1 Tax=Sulfurovum mangrovi TaxID=2893889 RepID=UPI001E364F77|nr:cation:proton antiporter [Sulfurovum mangrovi]UFH58108.1 cation:proton antiporter [Sulfurovum mangrovi]
MQTLLYIGIIFLLGALMQWASPKVGLPKVVGYLFLGLLIGPELLGIIPLSFVEGSHVVIDLALSLIAVLVGANLKYQRVKGLGKQIMTITLFEGLFAFLAVSIGFYLSLRVLGGSAEFAILLGGLAAATAPAATIAITHELKAKGKFTTTLLGVVALDDALALILFTFAVMLGGVFISGGELTFRYLWEVVWMIILSALLGGIGALISVLIDKLFEHHKGMETISTLGMVFIVYALSAQWELEPLFSALVMGVVMTNVSDDFDLVEEEIDNHLEEIIFMLFFILSAMHLDLSTLLTMPLVVISYVVFRLLGKVSGVWVGAGVSGADKQVKKYLGIGLMPQAGVAIGLALSLQNEPAFASIAPTLLHVVIATTVIHEFLGPIVTRYVLKKSGETHA